MFFKKKRDDTTGERVALAVGFDAPLVALMRVSAKRAGVRVLPVANELNVVCQTAVAEGAREIWVSERGANFSVQDLKAHLRVIAGGSDVKVRVISMDAKPPFPWIADLSLFSQA